MMKPEDIERLKEEIKAEVKAEILEEIRAELFDPLDIAKAKLRAKFRDLKKKKEA